MKLDIGSGEFRYKDFTTVDLYSPQADLKVDMGELPLEDNSVEEIWACHCLEHIRPEKVQPTLKEWLRVMKPGAIAKITVPDLDDACRAWLERKPISLCMIFGSIGVGMEHYHGWGALELRQELLDAGFEVLSVQLFKESTTYNLGGTYWHDMVNVYAEARKRGQCVPA